MSYRYSIQCCTLICAALAGCQAPPAAPSPATVRRISEEEHARRFGDFDPPRKIGSVESVSLQLPRISPDGEQMLYLRTDRESLPPMTVLGSADPKHTPADGVLSIWLRPAEGNSLGIRLSTCRWAHSMVWSDSGECIAYVANNSTGSMIVHMNLATGRITQSGVADAVNCFPQFAGDDETLLFCSSRNAAGPFRVFMYRIGEPEPVAISPEGADCVLPVVREGGGRVICAQLQLDNVDWVRADGIGTISVTGPGGRGTRMGWLQAWAGISTPLSPDRGSFMYYDSGLDRISVCHLQRRLTQRHRKGSIAACWLGNDAIALATDEHVFAVNTDTGMSLSLFNGQWIPCRYVPAKRRLILFGQEAAKRFLSVYEVVFQVRAEPAKSTKTAATRPM